MESGSWCGCGGGEESGGTQRTLAVVVVVVELSAIKQGLGRKRKIKSRKWNSRDEQDANTRRGRSPLRCKALSNRRTVKKKEKKHTLADKNQKENETIENETTTAMPKTSITDILKEKRKL